MHSYIISDLHLAPGKPQLIAAFAAFLQGPARTAEQLFILGDLFEYWIGDDAAELIGASPLLHMMKKASQHVDCYFIAGNRDFLVREKFERDTGFKILPDETIIDLYGNKTLILHGDSLCTDDIKHQEFRQSITTNRAACDEILEKTVEERIALAKQARSESQSNFEMSDTSIMDVNEQAVKNAFEKHQVKQMIHGHTHRQNIHQYQIGDVAHKRYVLGDWQSTASIMKIDANGIEISNPPTKQSWLSTSRLLVQALFYKIFHRP